MRYLSVCTGIEAASCAWHALGWTPAAFAEIEPFPSAVLAHHYPEVPNFGDFTKIEESHVGSIDLLVGGTPCQSFSVAGKRAGLDDARGNLTLEFARLAGRLRPRWLVWENVPGVLSIDGGRTFGTFLGILGELGYGVAYRVLDAQHFGVPQRRRRVFVVGCLGDWRRAAAVLFERHSLSGNPPPRREAGKDIAATVTGGSDTSRNHGKRSGSDRDTLIPAHYWNGSDVASTLDDGANGKWPAQVASTLNAHYGDKLGLDDQHALGGAALFVPAVVTHALRADGFDASEDGTGRGTPLVLIAFSAKDYGADAGETSPTLRAGDHTESHANGGVMPAVAMNLRGRDGGAMPEMDEVASVRAASGGSSRSHVASPLTASYGKQADSSDTSKGPPNLLLEGWKVRRLTPRECERLQGFPDDYTLVPWRGKTSSDGPRYKAIGNSMAVPVMAWIGKRIAEVEGITASESSAQPGDPSD